MSGGVFIKTKYLPKKLNFQWFVCLDFKINIKIEYNKENLILWEDIFFSDKSSHGKKIKPSSEEWANFWLKLDELYIWKWNESYTQYDTNYITFDGSSWSLNIIYGSKSIETIGFNAYPKNFIEFVVALETLIQNNLNSLREYLD